MSWTDRFIKLPISVYDREEKNLTGKENCYDSYMKVLPMDIVSYRPSFAVEEPDKEITLIVQKSGDSTLVNLQIKDFEELMDKSTM